MKRRIIYSKKEEAEKNRKLTISIILSLVLGSVVLFYTKNMIYSVVSIISSFVVIILYFYFSNVLKNSGRIKKIEEVFPDFLQLMSSNLRAGLTIDKAILLSSRPEFYPLDSEILKTGRDIVTSKNIEKALSDMGERIGSERIKKTLLLINSGIRAGGDIAILLEDTSVNMREREFLEKKVYSSVMMYFIFIFLVVAIFAPALFSLSNVLVEVLMNILSGIPKVETASSMPFTFSNVSISLDFIKYFSIIFIITIDLLASMILGLISKGEEKEGLKYLPIMLILSLGVFFLAKILISSFLSGFF